MDTGVSFDGCEKPYVPMGVLNVTLSRDLGKKWYQESEYVPSYWAMMLLPRSGLGTKYGVRFVNTIGLIDMDYRDTIKATLVCDRPVTIKRGERFMQGIIIPIAIMESEIKPKDKRWGGHGSTGV